MVKIGNVDEFTRILESDFGFIVEIQDSISIIHTTNCSTINANKFIEKTQRGSNYQFRWFSSLSSAEKEFSDLKSCNRCKAG